MKRTIKLILLLSLFVPVCQAQQKQVETVEEYKALYDSLVCALRATEKDTGNYVGKPFSEFVKRLEKHDVKPIRILLSGYDKALYPQNLWCISIQFVTAKNANFAWINKMIYPTVYIYFAENMPYEKALSLSKEYKSYFTKEVEEFYSGAVIKSIGFYFMDGMYQSTYKQKRE